MIVSCNTDIQNDNFLQLHYNIENFLPSGLLTFNYKYNFEDGF